MFSLYLAPIGGQSRVTLGGYNSSYVGSNYRNQSIAWNDLVNTNYWSLSLVSASIGDRQLMLSTDLAIVDSGTSYILIPNGKTIE